MRSTSRLLTGIAFSVAMSAALFSLLGLPSCGTDASGVEACRTIETARCEAAKACGLSDEEVNSCALFYRDQCLHGLENTDIGTPEESAVSACVAAIKAAAACKDKPLAMCMNVKLRGAPERVKTGCDIVMDAVEQLEACAFVIKPAPKPDGGAMTTGTTATGTTATGTGGQGGGK